MYLSGRLMYHYAAEACGPYVETPAPTPRHFPGTCQYVSAQFSRPYVEAGALNYAAEACRPYVETPSEDNFTLTDGMLCAGGVEEEAICPGRSALALKQQFLQHVIKRLPDFGVTGEELMDADDR